MLAFIWIIRRPPEPTYGGRRLSDWVRQYDENFRAGQGSNELRMEAEAAIKRIGTNAVPYLVAQVSARDAVWKAKLRRAVPDSWVDRLGINPGSTRRRGAHGLAALGTNAASALPDLIRIGTEQPEEDGRYIAVWTIGMLHSAAEPAIPFLIQCLTNQSDVIRWDAAYGLGYIHRRPEDVVPALIHYLELAKAGNPSDYHSGISALRAFGPQAREAVPMLLSLTSHSEDIEAHVKSALRRILPEVSSDDATR